VSTLNDSDDEASGDGPQAKKQKMNDGNEVATVTLEDDADQKVQQVLVLIQFFYFT
jgi:hypothetical protein